MATGHTLFTLYAHLDRLLEGIHALRSAGYSDFQVFSPTPNHEIAHALGGKPSPVRTFTLAGGLAGLAVGWWITIGPLANFHLQVGGKPLLSIPPFGVVAYICTILFGAVATLIGMMVNMRLPRPGLAAGYDPRLSSDHYGIEIRCGVGEEEKIVKLMKGCGAVAINRIRE